MTRVVVGFVAGVIGAALAALLFAKWLSEDWVKGVK